jgi:hypothetical protein
MWSTFHDAPERRKKTWSEALTSTILMFYGLQWDILKKIRKRANVEVLIFSYKTRYKEKHKNEPKSLLMLNQMIQDGNLEAELYFFENETFSNSVY